jgi:cell division protein FtsB
MTRLKATLAKLSSHLVLVVLVLAAVAFVLMFVFQSFRIREMRDQADQKKAELAQYQERNDKLQDQLAFLQSPGYMLYVELVARQALGLSRPGETVVLPVQQNANPDNLKPGQLSGSAASSKTPETRPKSGWESWWKFFFG